MKAFGVFAVYLLLIHANLEVRGSATFEWTLVSYNNPDGQDSWGQKCDFIDGNCDHVFRFGLDWLGGSNNASDTPLLTKITQRFDNERFNRFPSNQIIKGIQNPIVHVFNSWPGGIMLKTHIEDDDQPLKGSDMVDDIIYRLVAHAETSETRAVPSLTQATGKRTTLTFTWRFYCIENYYGSDCSKFCKGKDDSVNGHYTCDAFGNKICLQGWDDASNNCMIKLDDCTKNQCKNDAECINSGRSYKCLCKPGFTGRLCETNIDECSPDLCQNGATCQDGVNDYVCKCPPEFVGKNCSMKACTKSSPCLNGGTCYGDLNCYCSPNFVGAKCQDPMCKVAGCLNGGICSIDGACICKPGFKGMRCEFDLCTSIGLLCQNGGICIEEKCQCPKEFSGETCQESLLCSIITCERGTCAVVMLKDSEILAPQCQCPEGFSGKRCEIQLIDHSGESLTSNNTTSSSLSMFAILFIIFVILTIISIVVIVVLSVLLYRKTRRSPRSERSARSSSDIYSTMSETFTETVRSHKPPATPNWYEDGVQISKVKPENAKKSLDDHHGYERFIDQMLTSFLELNNK